MRKLVVAIIAGCVVGSVGPLAAQSNENEMARDLGAVLSWRLGPSVLEEHCRNLDPDGAEARKNSLKMWQTKNAALIESVDARVAEVIPHMRGAAGNPNMAQIVHEQVKQMLIETIFEGMTAEQSKAVCVAEAKPSSPRWNSNGIPQVPNSLAALHDWKVTRTSGN